MTAEASNRPTVTIAAKSAAFILPDQDGKLVAVEDQSGRWVVVCFCPEDDTPGCTFEAFEFVATTARRRTRCSSPSRNSASACGWTPTPRS
jgi:peroxiredoxin